jgi:hypothetical protein
MNLRILRNGGVDRWRNQDRGTNLKENRQNLGRSATWVSSSPLGQNINRPVWIQLFPGGGASNAMTTNRCDPELRIECTVPAGANAASPAANSWASSPICTTPVTGTNWPSLCKAHWFDNGYAKIYQVSFNCESP